MGVLECCPVIAKSSAQVAHEVQLGRRFDVCHVVLERRNIGLQCNLAFRRDDVKPVAVSLAMLLIACNVCSRMSFKNRMSV